MEDTGEVHGHEPVPGLERALPRPRGTLNARVVAEHVHRAEPVAGLCGERLDRLPPGDVRRDGNHLGVGGRPGSEAIRGRAQAVSIDVRHHDAHAFGREPLAERVADPVGGPGNDGDPITKLVHRFSTPAR